jgi:hypothetical protein
MYNDDDVFINVHTGSRAPYSEWVEDYQDAVLKGFDKELWPKSLPDCINDGDLIQWDGTMILRTGREFNEKVHIYTRSKNK